MPEDFLARGLKALELLIVDGGKGLEVVLASLRSDDPVRLCTCTGSATSWPTRSVGAGQTLDRAPVKQPIDLAVQSSNHCDRELRR